jgi:hypothetical protein
MVFVPPYRGVLWRIKLPGLTWVRKVVKTAEVPLEKRSAASAPSHTASRPSTTTRFGWSIRVYMNPTSSPSFGVSPP